MFDGKDMKKTVFILLSCVMLGSEALAAELVIRLKSGTTLVVSYTGDIEGVALKEGNDAIAGVNVLGKKLDPALPKQRSGQHSTATKQPRRTEDGVEKSNTMRFKWAEPKIED